MSRDTGCVDNDQVSATLGRHFNELYGEGRLARECSLQGLHREDTDSYQVMRPRAEYRGIRGRIKDDISIKITTS